MIKKKKLRYDSFSLAFAKNGMLCNIYLSLNDNSDVDMINAQIDLVESDVVFNVKVKESVLLDVPLEDVYSKLRNSDILLLDRLLKYVVSSLEKGIRTENLLLLHNALKKKWG